MENLNKKIDAIKASWAELVLAFANSEAIGDTLDTINRLIRSFAENEEAISVVTGLVKALLAIKAIAATGSFLGGLITSVGQFIGKGKIAVSTAKDFIIILKSLKNAGIELTAAQMAMKAGIAGFGASVAGVLPAVLAFGGAILALGVATGKFGELYNKHIANTSDDVNKVADAYLNLVKAQKEFEHPSKGVGVKTVTGQEALDTQIKKLEELRGQYDLGIVSAEEFLKAFEKGGSGLVDYYNSLQNIIDSGGKLTKVQQQNYDSLSPLIASYNGASKVVESTAESVKTLTTATGELNGVYKSSQSIYDVYAQQLTKVGDTYYFISQAAKDSSIATQKAIIAEAQTIIEQTTKEIAARKQLATVLGAKVPASTKASQDLFGSTKLKSADALFNETSTAKIKEQQSVVNAAEKALAELQKLSVGGSVRGTSGASGGSGSGSGSKSKSSRDASYLSNYKKQLEQYQKDQEQLYKKGEITASQYYSNVQKKGYSYYKKLKAMGKDYADDAKSMLEDYKNTNTDTVNSIFDEIDYRYEQGQITGQKYYDEIWKYAKKFYKNGKLDFDSYRDYVKKGYEAMFENIKKQYESGKISLEQYQSRVSSATTKAQGSIGKSGLSKAAVKEAYNALIEATASAKNAISKALKEAAVEAAEAAVKAAEKQLEEAQKRQSRANAMIEALQFWADKQTDAIDKTIDGYNEQIDKLNEQLDLLDEQNDALDKQAERVKLVNELENAKKQKTVRIYDSRLGWVWSADPNAVKNAQEALDDFDTARKREQEQQAIRDQISAIEDLIKQKEKEKQAYQDVIDEQTEALNRYNIEAELGMTIEEAIFAQRTQNFDNWKDSYIRGTQEVISAIEAVNAAQANLDYANSQLDYANAIEYPETKVGYTKTTGAAYTYDSSMSSADIVAARVRANMALRESQGYDVTPRYDSSGNLVGYKASSTSTSRANVKAGTATELTNTKKKAGGSLSIPQSGVYNINELGDELIVPPKGNLSFLQKGTGVIPAHLTQNLMGWGKLNPNTFMNSRQMTTSDDHSITIQNLTVQSNDAKDFVRQLQNLAIVRG